MENNFIPASDIRTLSARCAAALRAASELMESIARDLPAEKQGYLNKLLAGGGRVGVEMTVDRHGNNSISLVGIEYEKTRYVLATVQTTGDGFSNVPN